MATRRTKSLVWAVSTGVVAVLVAIGLISGAFASAGRAALYGTGLWVDGGASTVPAGLFSPPPTPTSAPSTPTVAGPVLSPASTGRAVDPEILARRIAAVPRNDVGRIAGVVLDGETGTPVYRSDARARMIPASTMKLLTSAAVLSALGPAHRFTTSVVQGAKSGELVLVGGGDPYLLTVPDPDHPERASLDVLARQVAEKLARAGTRTVTLGYDASLFAGPGWNPQWPKRYGDEVASTSALWVDGARTNKVTPGPRDADPARAAAVAFAGALKKYGIAVTAVTVSKASADAVAVAEAESEPLEVIVESVLRFSDNDAAEVLFRHVSVRTDGDGSLKAASVAVRAQLTELGVWIDDTRVVDGSGMARQNAVPAELVAKIVAAALDDDHPELRSLLTGLPVAGADGSLRSRFFSPGTELGRGAVRAKTGTLTKVHALGGYTRTESGRVLVFAFIVNDPEKGTGNAFADRVFLDRVTAAVTGCGC